MSYSPYCARARSRAWLDPTSFYPPTSTDTPRATMAVTSRTAAQRYYYYYYYY